MSASQIFSSINKLSQDKLKMDKVSVAACFMFVVCFITITESIQCYECNEETEKECDAKKTVVRCPPKMDHCISLNVFHENKNTTSYQLSCSFPEGCQLSYNVTGVKIKSCYICGEDLCNKEALETENVFLLSILFGLSVSLIILAIVLVCISMKPKLNNNYSNL